MSELLVRPQTTNRDSQGQAGPGAYQVLPHSQLLSYLHASSFHRVRFSGNASTLSRQVREAEHFYLLRQKMGSDLCSKKSPS